YILAVVEDDEISHAARKRQVGRVREILARKSLCAAILDELGWEQHGTSDEYHLTVTEPVRELVASLADNMEGTMHDNEERDDQRLLELDRMALSAASEVLAVA
ncbi:MAG TPA: hypothetical protein VFP55_09120, partial [Solirubrobacteraceae bacterium]|nr:hypothetical protein [Solirubrobacteraceae bacterium]